MGRPRKEQPSLGGYYLQTTVKEVVCLLIEKWGLGEVKHFPECPLRLSVVSDW